MGPQAAPSPTAPDARLGPLRSLPSLSFIHVIAALHGGVAVC
jgi:hypothetical protein